jgi:ATP-dependent DNA helicase DinG
MAQVIALDEARRAPREAPDFIDDAYRRLAALPGFRVRPDQAALSREVCRALVAGEPLAAEAPTGTGKTFAYLIGALAAAELLAAPQRPPVVIATATVGLQQQVLAGDLPRLVEAGILAEGEAVLAKGRRRYFCVLAAEQLVEEGTQGSQLDLLDAERNAQLEEVEAVREMLEQFHGRAWDGDFDAYCGTPTSARDKVSASADTCLGRRCPYFDICPFFRARARLAHARVIVANQDLVLSDLAMARAEKDPLFPATHYLCVFDEAHNLPDKALEAGSAHLQLETTRAELARLPLAWKAVSRHVELVRLLARQGIEAGSFDPAALTGALQACTQEVCTLAVEDETRQLRFAAGVLPDGVRAAAELTLSHARAQAKTLEAATESLRGTNLGERGAALASAIGEGLRHLSGFGGQLRDLVRALELFVDARRAVRWVYHDGPQASLHVCPLEGADVLREVLWVSPRVRVAMVSATLRDFAGFERFAARAGTPANLRTVALPHIFPYHECELRVVDMAHSPRFETRESYERELAELLPRAIDPIEGTLVLFPSRRLLQRTLPALREALGTQVLVQGELGIRELVREYRRRRETGQGAVLCGLATLAEGLDLPGALCTHVIVCALPFTVPTSPVERELAEQMGARYFRERVLPDALVRLIQMVGRLMRRETDRGRITLFDKRLVSTQWGRKLLAALPPFRRRRLRPRDLQAPIVPVARPTRSPLEPPA